MGNGEHGSYEKAGQAQAGGVPGPQHESHSSQDSHSPTHIFLGGGASAPVLARCAALLAPGGRMVVAAVLLSTLETARAVLNRLGWPLTVHQLMHHASSPLGGDLREGKFTLPLLLYLESLPDSQREIVSRELADANLHPARQNQIIADVAGQGFADRTREEAQSYLT
ncbi:hypothetical protein JWG42_19280, partial [Desulfoprunum benzoelyticum]